MVLAQSWQPVMGCLALSLSPFKFRVGFVFWFFFSTRAILSIQRHFHGILPQRYLEWTQMLILPRISQKHNCYLITFFLHRYVKHHTSSYHNFLFHISMFRFFFQIFLYCIMLYLHSGEITVPLKNLVAVEAGFQGGQGKERERHKSVGNQILLVLR